MARLDHLADVVSHLGVRHHLQVLLRRRTDNLEDNIELVLVVLPLQEGLAAEDFCEYAPRGPDVDGFRILLEIQQLRRPVPSGNDIGCHGARTVFLLQACEAKVTDF